MNFPPAKSWLIRILKQFVQSIYSSPGAICAHIENFATAAFAIILDFFFLFILLLLLQNYFDKCYRKFWTEPEKNTRETNRAIKNRKYACFKWKKWEIFESKSKSWIKVVKLRGKNGLENWNKIKQKRWKRWEEKNDDNKQKKKFKIDDDGNNSSRSWTMNNQSGNNKNSTE